MTRKTFDRVMTFRSRDRLWAEACLLEDMEERPSLRKAVRLLKQSVHQGLQDARGNLAAAYDKGSGVRYSRRMAVHWYYKWWRSGSATAAKNLGITMRIEGRITTAVLWFHRAIASGDPDAKFFLAKIYLKNPSRRAEALSLLQEFVAVGPQMIYTYGKGVESVQVDDEAYEEAKQLLKQLKGGASD